MQLVAYGAQDVYLTGNPQITFFKVVYRRHTNFACEAIEQTFNGSAEFGKKVTATISRNGDLITNVYLQASLPDVGAAGAEYCNSVGHALVKTCELEIGGQRIDKHYSEWLEIWSELTLPEEKKVGYSEMVGKFETNVGKKGGTIYVPFMFFFNRNPGLALPLIALQYHEVRIAIEFRKFSELLKGNVQLPEGNMSLGSASLFVDYVYLDTDERRRFAQVSHEMLIEQLQFTGDESVGANQPNQKIRMNFNHPVKELIFVVQNDNATDENDYFNFAATDGDVHVDPLESAKILLNGHDRFSERPGSYFRLVQPYQHHTRVPRKMIYSYSFALKPEEHQPSGTCNFSRIDNATLVLKLRDGLPASKVKIYAVNYNVLRIVSGMGGLAYSN